MDDTQKEEFKKIIQIPCLNLKLHPSWNFERVHRYLGGAVAPPFAIGTLLQQIGKPQAAMGVASASASLLEATAPYMTGALADYLLGSSLRMTFIYELGIHLWTWHYQAARETIARRQGMSGGRVLNICTGQRCSCASSTRNYQVIVTPLARSTALQQKLRKWSSYGGGIVRAPITLTLERLDIIKSHRRLLGTCTDVLFGRSMVVRIRFMLWTVPVCILRKEAEQQRYTAERRANLNHPNKDYP